MILIFETHPVQYRAPLYRQLNQKVPGTFVVIYGCLNPGFDREFGQSIQWDNNLLDGYPYETLDTLKPPGLGSRRSLSGSGVASIIRKYQPRAVLLSSLRYHFDFAVWFTATRKRIPLWIRMETQDEAFVRNPVQSLVRNGIYRILYRPVSKAFYIGELNRKHYLRHGIKPSRFVFTPYVVPNPYSNVPVAERKRRALEKRHSMGIHPRATVVAFFGKLIAKKNPDLLLAAYKEAAQKKAGPWELLYIGSGEMEEQLRKQAATISAPVRFTGFQNQSALADFYLASDIVVLPSRRRGETWGLVVNEGLQAGCAVAVSDAVGCHPQFSNLERFRIFPEGDTSQCTQALLELAEYPRSWDWADSAMRHYSIQSVAETLSSHFKS